MIAAFQYYFPNVIDNIHQKHFKTSPTPSRLELQKSSRFESPKPSQLELQKPTQLEMLIEDKFLGKIIGRGGRTIDQIRIKSQAKIAVYRELYDTKRRVVISGCSESIQKAKSHILELCC